MTTPNRNKRPARKKPYAGQERYWLYGLHPVRAALVNPARKYGKLLATRNAAANLGEAPFPPDIVERKAIDRLVPADAVHQGIALEVDPLPETSLADLIDGSENMLLLVLDQVTDPHNVGAILRSAAAFGSAAVVTTWRHSPPETAVLAKSAAGAVDLIPYVRIRNLADALSTLSDAGFHIVGLDADGGTKLQDVANPGRIAVVMGAEGKGLRQLTRERCDQLARLPMKGDMESLNVSNAAAIALYELTRD